MIEPKDYPADLLQVYIANKGYVVFDDKRHPLGGKRGLVYMHRHIASVKLGRWVRSDEDVHHLDGNKLNNKPDNLEVISHSEHSHEHNGINPPITHECAYCGQEFTRKACLIGSFCSNQCRANTLKYGNGR
jgi:hypothetical protein